MVAAVLHLHEGAGAAFEPVDQMRGGLLHRHDVVDRDLLLAADAERGRIEHVAGRAPGLGVELLFVADDAADVRQRDERVRLDLRGAAGDHDARVRPLARDPADRLLRLPHRLGRHRAGVDDHGVAEPSPAASALRRMISDS